MNVRFWLLEFMLRNSYARLCALSRNRSGSVVSTRVGRMNEHTSWPLLTRAGLKLRAGGRHGADSSGGVGANNEGARGDIASDGQEDHLVASRRNFGNQQPDDAAVEVEIRARRF